MKAHPDPRRLSCAQNRGPIFVRFARRRKNSNEHRYTYNSTVVIEAISQTSDRGVRIIACPCAGPCSRPRRARNWVVRKFVGIAEILPPSGTPATAAMLWPPGQLSVAGRGEGDRRAPPSGLRPLRLRRSTGRSVDTARARDLSQKNDEFSSSASNITSPI